MCENSPTLQEAIKMKTSMRDLVINKYKEIVDDRNNYHKKFREDYYIEPYPNFSAMSDDELLENLLKEHRNKLEGK